MPASNRSLGRVVLVIVLGALIGTLLGEVVGIILPEGVVEDFFLAAAHMEVGPGTFDAGLFSITLGFSVKLNVIGLLGIGVAIYLLRWY